MGETFNQRVVKGDNPPDQIMYSSLLFLFTECCFFVVVVLAEVEGGGW